MTDVADLERRVLTAARQHLEPSPGDESRLLAALTATLGRAALETPSDVPEAAIEPGVGTVGSLAASAGVKLSTLAVVSALVGATGFGAGYAVGYSSSGEEGKVPVERAELEAASSQQPSRSGPHESERPSAATDETSSEADEAFSAAAARRATSGASPSSVTAPAARPPSSA